MSSLTELPKDLPVPQDDGACRHLTGLAVPDISLLATSVQRVSLAELASKHTVLYIYPMTGRPDRNLPGDWDVIPSLEPEVVHRSRVRSATITKSCRL
jgi:hypothetical protein